MSAKCKGCVCWPVLLTVDMRTYLPLQIVTKACGCTISTRYAYASQTESQAFEHLLQSWICGSPCEDTSTAVASEVNLALGFRLQGAR